MCPLCYLGQCFDHSRCLIDIGDKGLEIKYCHFCRVKRWEKRETKTRQKKEHVILSILGMIVEITAYANYYLSAAWPVIPGQRQRSW